jgi:hypothetical protein
LKKKSNDKLKKLLLISYFYPPCNLTASQRVAGWAKYLHESGYYPIVVTRHWDKPIQQPEDVLRSSGKSLYIEKHPTHEVHYLPYQAGLRDRVFTRLAGTKFQWISKFFTAIELVMENFLLRVIPHRNLYTHADKLLSEDKSIQQVLISGNPFNQFAIGYHLKRKHAIEWVADYRDDWNTSELEIKPYGSSRFIAKLQARSEKKWVGSAACITSVSPYYVDKISRFVNRPGHVVLNGYDFQLPNPSPEPEVGVFRITYNGSLYGSQRIDLFLEACAHVISKYANSLKIEIHFPGLAFDPGQAKRVENLTHAFRSHVFITPRLPKEDVIHLQLRSDLLLMVAHTDIKGVPSSKLFEYIGLNRTILVCPSDHDVIAAFIGETNSGYLADTLEECKTVLEHLIRVKQGLEPLSIQRNELAGAKYSRKEQAKVLAALLDQTNYI